MIEKSGSYWFELTDHEGFRGGSDDRWEIHAVADAPPVVSIQQPAANLLVTPRAVVPLRVSAKDDLALRDVMLVFRAGDAGPERTVPLWTADGSPHPNPLPAGEGTFPSPLPWERARATAARSITAGNWPRWNCGRAPR